jgi:hypothetical protein
MAFPQADGGAPQTLRLTAIANDSSSQVEWEKEFGGRAWVGYADFGKAMTHDQAGNVYMIISSEPCFEMIVAKYTPAGERVWIARHRPGMAEALAVDADGNLYVAGGTPDGITTVKFNADGQEVWTAAFGEGVKKNEYPMAVDLAVAGNGDVCVLGIANGYQLIRYNGDGVQLWTSHAGAGYDQPLDLELDGGGNAYVTGWSIGPRAMDFLTVKYTPSGSEAWAARYDGPGNAYDSSDFALRIGIDANQNVYVLGLSTHVAATVKYDAAGTWQWVQSYNGLDDLGFWPQDMAVSPAGNVYVTGFTGVDTSVERVTLKYSSDGVRRWVAHDKLGVAAFDGEIGIDAADNVYAGGTTVTDDETAAGFGVFKYNSEGARQWKALYIDDHATVQEALGMTVDAAGACVVTGGSNHAGSGFDVVTAKFDPDGQTSWAADIALSGPEGTAQAMNVDRSGNVFVTGFSGWDYMLAKFTPAGDTAWSRILDGPGYNPYLQRTPLGLDASGNVYVATTHGVYPNQVYAVTKYSPGGDHVRTADFPGYLVRDLSVDDAGHVAVIGGWGRITAARYDAGGALLWYVDRGIEDQFPGVITQDGAGDVYIAFQSFAAPQGITTVKYGPSGTEEWVQSYDANLLEEPTAIAVDTSGNVYVAGKSGLTYENTDAGVDFVVIKYASNGTERWVRRYNGPGNSNDSPSAIALDDLGNLVVTGKSAGVNGDFDFATLKYDPYGNLAWAARYAGSAGGNDEPVAVLLDSGDVLIAGRSAGVDRLGRVTIVRYDKGGQEEWSTTAPGPGHADNTPVGLGRDPMGYLYVAGTTDVQGVDVANGGPLWSVVKFRQPPGFGFVPPPPSGAHAAMAYGSAEISCTADQTVMIRNDGRGELRIASAVADDRNFAVTHLPASIAPGASGSVVIRFAPLTAGAKSANLIITHNGASSPDTAVLSGTGTGNGSEILFERTVDPGWQLMSLPVSGACPPEMPVYSYSGGYHQQYLVEPGVGYWYKAPGTNIAFPGYPVAGMDISVNARWNIIGSISTSVPVSAIRSVPEDIVTSFYFTFKDGGYQLADAIEPGLGYWVNVSQPGQLSLASSSGAPSKAPADRIVSAGDALTFTDASGRVQRLYVTPEFLARQVLDRYALPPAPPEGSFDVRFASGRMLESVNAVSTHAGITLASAVYPVTMAWSIRSGATGYRLVLNGRASHLAGTGEMAIGTQPQSIALITGEQVQLPLAYALDQNYPNPFNPMTVITYSLPSSAHVHLTVYNLLGEMVETLVDGTEEAGYKSVTFNASALPSGVYTCRLTAGTFTETRKMLLVK